MNINLVKLKLSYKDCYKSDRFWIGTTLGSIAVFRNLTFNTLAIV